MALIHSNGVPTRSNILKTYPTKAMDGAADEITMTGVSTGGTRTTGTRGDMGTINTCGIGAVSGA